MKRSFAAALSGLALTLQLSAAQAQTEVIMAPPETDNDVRRDHAVTLVEKALAATVDTHGPYTVTEAKVVKSQARVLQELAIGRGLVNVAFSGTSIEREQDLLAIRIPVVKGLMGHRISFIRRERQAEFDAMTSPEDLKQLRPCQGSDWPDAEVLRLAGFDVVTSPYYESLFKMLDLGRCDYFPRAPHEIYLELDKFAERFPDMVVERNWMLRYPYASYFFVNRSDTALAERIETGLRRLIADGGFDHHMDTHPATAGLVEKTGLLTRRIVDLPNPMMSAETPLDRAELWFNPARYPRQVAGNDGM